MNLVGTPTIGSSASLAIAGSTTLNAGGTADPLQQRCDPFIGRQ